MGKALWPLRQGEAEGTAWLHVGFKAKAFHAVGPCCETWGSSVEVVLAGLASPLLAFRNGCDTGHQNLLSQANLSKSVA